MIYLFRHTKFLSSLKNLMIIYKLGIKLLRIHPIWDR